MTLLVWTLIDCERLVHVQKKIGKFCYKLSVLVFYHKQAATGLDDSFQLSVCYFFMNWDNISFFPFDWKFPIESKKANVVPVHKKNSKQLIENYRSISLVPVCGKILERIICNKMFEFFFENELILHNAWFKHKF